MSLYDLIMDDTRNGPESQKKTDYTYSNSISYRSEATPDRKVGSPNMSRRRLRTDKLNYEDFYNNCSNSDYSSINNLSLRSRIIDRPSMAGTDYSVSDSTLGSGISEGQSIQQRLNYGLDDSDSEGDSFASTKRYKSPQVRRGNGHPTQLVTKSNGMTTTTVHYLNEYKETSTIPQRQQTSFLTYTADDDRPSRVFIKKVTQRLSHVFYAFWSWICASLASAVGVIRNPVVAAASFQSWSARSRTQPWQHTTTTHVNTTSQTTVTYVRQYVSSVVNNCGSYYSRKRRTSPFLWWWIPLLLLISLLLFALWWQYGERYEEQTIFFASRLQSIKEAYYPKDSQWLTWFEALIGRCYTVVGEAALSIWILIRGFVLAIPAFVKPYFIGNETGTSSEYNVGTKEMQAMVRLMQEAHSNHLAKLEYKIESEMALMVTNLDELKQHTEKRYQNDETIAELRKQQHSLLMRLEALTATVKSFAPKSKDNDEDKKVIYEQVSTLSRNVDELNEDVVDLKTHYAELRRTTQSCCNKTFVTADDMERHMVLATTELLRGFNASMEGVKSWVKNYFMAKGALDARMNAAVRNYQEDLTQKNQDVMKTFQQTADIVLQESLMKFKSEFEAQKVQQTSHRTGATNAGEGSFSAGLASVRGLWNQSKIEMIVNEMLKKYDADRTGMVDHALESAGGTVASTRCTDNYQIHLAQPTVFGIGLWKYPTNTPRSVIQPNRNPGECFAFRGSLGYVVIQLARPVQLSGFTMEHIPKSLSPSGTIDSAPRMFSVHGLQKVEGDVGHKLGNYTFLDNGESLQYFEVQNRSDKFFPIVELKVHSNHGNLIYTCLYRFRVHGVGTNDVY